MAALSTADKLEPLVLKLVTKTYPLTLMTYYGKCHKSHQQLSASNNNTLPPVCWILEP